MAYSSSIIRQDVYSMFLEIDRAAFRSIIQFYERHQKDIHHLEEKESLELNIVYLQSLFEIGAYENFLK